MFVGTCRCLRIAALRDRTILTDSGRDTSTDTGIANHPT